MRLNRLKLTIIITISVVLLFQIEYSQPKILRGFKIGIDFPGYKVNDNGSLPNDPSISFGYFTGVNMYSTSDDVFLFGFEFNYTRINYYRVNYTLRYGYEYKDNLFVFDQKFRYAFIEIGLFPEYHHLINDNSVIGVYVGPSGGIGTQELYLNEVRRTLLDTLNYNGELYPPYGEYNMDRYKSFACFNLGARYYYGWFMVDVRYRYTYVGNLKEVNHFKNVFLQVGITL